MILALLPSAFAEEDVQALAAEVARLRGETLDAPVHAEVIDDAGLAALLRRLLAEDPTAAENAPVAHLLARVGLLPDGADLAADAERILQAQVAGLYEPADATLYVIHGSRPVDAVLDRMVLSHEIAHALDDRDASIDTFQAAHTATLDEQLVTGAIVEGSASVQMVRVLFDDVRNHRVGMGALLAASTGAGPQYGDLHHEPAYWQNALVAPYLLGMSWLLGGGLAVDTLATVPDPTHARVLDAMRSPPASTAAMLHPDAPPPVVADVSAVATRAGLTVRHVDRLGEVFVAAALGRAVPSGQKALQLAPWTDRAATGWTGDTFVVATTATGAPADVWLSAWATATDRDEFTRAWRRRHHDAPVTYVGTHAAVVAWGVDAAAFAAGATWTQGGAPWSP